MQILTLPKTVTHLLTVGDGTRRLDPITLQPASSALIKNIGHPNVRLYPGEHGLIYYSLKETGKNQYEEYVKSIAKETESGAKYVATHGPGAPVSGFNDSDTSETQ